MIGKFQFLRSLVLSKKVNKKTQQKLGLHKQKQSVPQKEVPQQIVPKSLDEIDDDENDVDIDNI